MLGAFQVHRGTGLFLCQPLLHRKNSIQGCSRVQEFTGLSQNAVEANEVPKWQLLCESTF